jgi:hypothetical protein
MTLKAFSAGSLLLVSILLPGIAFAAPKAIPEGIISAGGLGLIHLTATKKFQAVGKCRWVSSKDCSQARHPNQCKTVVKRVCS